MTADPSGRTVAAASLLRGWMEREARVAVATQPLRQALNQRNHYTDLRGVNHPLSEMSAAEASLVLALLERHAVTLHRGELAEHLLRLEESVVAAGGGRRGIRRAGRHGRRGLASPDAASPRAHRAHRPVTENEKEKIRMSNQTGVANGAVAARGRPGHRRRAGPAGEKPRRGASGPRRPVPRSVHRLPAEPARGQQPMGRGLPLRGRDGDPGPARPGRRPRSLEPRGERNRRGDPGLPAAAVRRRALRDRSGQRPLVAVGQRVQTVRASLRGRALPDPAAAGATEAGRRDPGQLEGPAVCHGSAPGRYCAGSTRSRYGRHRIVSARSCLTQASGLATARVSCQPTPRSRRRRKRRSPSRRARRRLTRRCCGLLASSGQIDPAELANLIYAAVGESPRPSARAAAALDTLLDRIPEEVAQRTLHDIAARADQLGGTGPVLQPGWGNGVPGAGM